MKYLQFKAQRKHNWLFDQWRIQDFPEEGVPTPRGEPTYDFAKFPQNCMKLKEFGPGGERASLAPPLDPQLLMVKAVGNDQDILGSNLTFAKILFVQFI